jgi:hypothetical protein
VIINNRGEVQQVTGFQKIAERIARKSGIDIRTVRQYLRDYIGDEIVRDLLSQLFFFLPGKKIQKEDRWVKNITTTANTPVKFSYLVTASDIDIENDTVKLNVQSVISAKTGEEGRQYGEGEINGVISASHSTGMPYHFELIQTITTHTDRYDVTNKRIIRVPGY